MISAEEIRKKALRFWTGQRFLKADLAGEDFFPLVIPFRSPTARELLADYAAVRKWARVLREKSKDGVGYGYRVEIQAVNHRKLGNQELPVKILFETREDFLRYIGKQGEYRRFREDYDRIVAAQPALKAWIADRPLTVLKYHGAWPELLAVCRFFQNHPAPNRYLRELDIPGVDTKFIEQHKPVLREMLETVLPPESLRLVSDAAPRHAFEQRFGLKHDLPLIRFRLLDPALAEPFGGLTDISTPISQFRTLDVPCRRVFITENKTNGLSFPDLADSIVIFGLGYGAHTLGEVDWLRDREIIYWGDIDTHGFAMLSMIRGYFPRTRSLFMDEATLLAFKHLWVTEPVQTRCTADLRHLTAPEQALYDTLRGDVLGERVRLEQERIGFGAVREALEEVSFGADLG